MLARTADKRFGALGRIGLVAAIHVAAFLMIARSLGIGPMIALEPKRVQAEFIDEPRPLDPPPRPIDERDFIDRPQLTMPAPDLPPIEDDTSQERITAVVRPVDEIPIGPGTADPEPVNVLNVRADPRRPLSQPPYPASLIRSGTEGYVDLEVFVQPNGRVADARIVRSSGHELFDRATLEEARRNWKLLPATRNGEPFAQWHRLRVVFRLKNQ
jgi:TonB family protein